MQRRYVHLALLLVNLIYGANYTIAKIALPQYVKPFAFILIRVGSAVLFYFTLLLLFFREKIHWKHVPMLILCGIFGVAINQICFFVGLSQTTEINAALLMITTPILVLAFGVFAKRETLHPFKIAGIFLGALGALVLLKGKGSPFSFNSTTLKGDIFIFINAASYSVYLVLVKSLMKTYKPITVISWVFLFGSIPVLFMGWTQFTEIDWKLMPLNAWLSIIYVVVGTTFFAYLLNIFALKHAEPSLVGIYIYTQPVFAAFLTIVMGKQQISWSTILSAALIFSGVYLVNDPGGKLQSATRRLSNS